MPCMNGFEHACKHVRMHASKYVHLHRRVDVRHRCARVYASIEDYAVHFVYLHSYVYARPQCIASLNLHTCCLCTDMPKMRTLRT